MPIYQLHGFGDATAPAIQAAREGGGTIITQGQDILRRATNNDQRLIQAAIASAGASAPAPAPVAAAPAPAPAPTTFLNQWGIPLAAGAGGFLAGLAIMKFIRR